MDLKFAAPAAAGPDQVGCVDAVEYFFHTVDAVSLFWSGH